MLCALLGRVDKFNPLRLAHGRVRQPLFRAKLQFQTDKELRRV
jgi:hypothetical protein